MCNRLDEDRAHLFFKCKWAVKVWRELGMEQYRCILEGKMSAAEAMQFTLGLDEGEQMIVVTILWLWWLERNRVREGERRKSVEDMAFMCNQYASKYLSICKQNPQPVQATKHVWKRPVQGWVKINSDGAFSSRTGEGGWGVIIRDERGEVMEAADGKLTRLLDAF